MIEELRDDLKSRGWTSGTYRGFVMTRRGGIEWEVGAAPGGERIALRWRYRTERTDRDGETLLPGNATRATVEDAMTGIYLSVHERPDPTRVFGGGRRGSAGAGRAGETTASGAPAEPIPPTPEEAGQGSFDL